MLPQDLSRRSREDNTSDSGGRRFREEGKRRSVIEMDVISAVGSLGGVGWSQR
jgi:hypothetical protein